jgi:hypothetical protein
MLRQLILAAAGVAGTLFVHLGVLFWLLRRDVLAARLRSVTLLAFALVFAHLIEISIYAALYWAGESWGLGQLHGEFVGKADEYFYYSASTYTTVGFGDITPSGPIRMITSAEALAGLSLITWSASFTFLQMQRAWRQ